MENAIELRHVTKTFGRVTANRDVSLELKKGEILSLLGENGSGKTTLMNMIAGIYYPDEGEIFVNGRRVEIRSPKDAYNLGIAMIHQHFKLVDVFTALENIALGLDKKEKYDLAAIRKRAGEICEKYRFDLDLNQKVYEMSVSQKQTLEIVKALFRGADILILDEPTAVLTPQETEKLFDVLRNMRKDSKSVVLITHKLHEVLEISNRVAILRKGEYVGTVETKDATESLLTEMMVGQKVELNIHRSQPENPRKRLEIRGLTVYSREGVKVLDDISFDVYSGEILGIAGVSGNGQKELLEAIAGLQGTAENSSITFYGDDAKMQLIGMTPRKIRDAGIHLSFVPEDRLGMGLVGSMGMIDNMMLKSYDSGKSFLADRKGPRELAEKVKEELGVVTPGVNTPVSRLSGGNVQKVLVGREIAADPIVLMTAYAVRGLDIHTSYTIYHLLNEQKEKGVAVIYVGEDLDVLLDLCDRIFVLCGGKGNGMLDGRTATKEQVGLLMTNLKNGGGES
ncbi:MAG TPA: ABC transporter ATP-binding protein [Candidatus Scatomonas merdigallinarum]|nr:ABC transporter ATP-binding protein [Candidatus Scatomonas merdigallinarum]